jgi:hypothetical protein
MTVADNAMPRIAEVLSLRDSPLEEHRSKWAVLLDYGGFHQMVVVSTRQLRSFNRFNGACMEQLLRCFDYVKKPEWSRRVDDALQRRKP